ncbi:MAG: FG-GAP repeat protein [Planctomycetes bacterium]|nr:FG-GAP repeat protein [Planctomycetota bacterium]
MIGIPRATVTSAQGTQFGAGAAAVFRFDGAIWVEEGRLIAAPANSETHAGDEFGSAVAMDADRIIVGRPKSDDVPGPAGNGDSGSAFVFRYDGAAWVQEAKLLAADAGSGDLFGIAVAIDGDWSMVAAIGDRIPTAVGGAVGSVYVFHRQGAAWCQTQKLNASDAAAGRLFGSSLSLLGDTAAVGDRSGSGHYAYVFRRHGMTWIEEAKVRGSDTTVGNGGDRFGVSVALAPNLLAVGADRDDDQGLPSSGSAFIFEYQAGQWVETRKLHAPTLTANDQFGYSLAASHSTLLVGSRLTDVGGQADAGAAYAFPLLAADCNCNRRADSCEITDGLAADCNGNGVPDECEVFRSGDCTCDGVLDLLDYPRFHDCLAGPEGGLAAPDCACADATGDGAVDLRDFAELQRVFSLP